MNGIFSSALSGQQTNHLSRRQFLSATSIATGALILPNSTPSAERELSGRKLAGFSKAFQELAPKETAEIAAQVGWDGIECTVRRGGHILPERVEDDLPRMHAALRERGLELFAISTDIAGRPDRANERVLRTASRLGVRLYRIAHLSYQRTRPLPEQIKTIRRNLSELEQLNRELGLCAIYENHSGSDSVGAPVWDAYQLVDGLDPQRFGIAFDIGHATVEGGSAWALHFRLVQPYLKAVYVKDFSWRKKGEGWAAAWCPLGEGMVDPKFFQELNASGFNGPIVQFHEYEVGRGAERLAAFKTDLAALQKFLAKK